MLNKYTVTDRKVIERTGESGTPQVVACSPTKVKPIFLEQLIEHLTWLERERERMASIVVRQAKELAQAEMKIEQMEIDADYAASDVLED